MIPPLFDQCQYSMLERQNVEVDLAPLYPELGTTVFGGLASGLLSGKYSSDPSTWREEWRLAGSEDVAERAQAVERLRPMATRLGGHDRLQASLLAGLPPSQRWRGVPGCSLAQLALAWCCTNRFVSTVILGATRVEQLVDNFAGLAVVEKLTPDVLAEIEALLDVRKHRLLFFTQVLNHCWGAGRTRRATARMCSNGAAATAPPQQSWGSTVVGPGTSRGSESERRPVARRL